MLILRILLILSALAIVISGSLYLFTKNRRYLNLAWKITRIVLVAAILVGLFYVLERYVLIGIRTIL
jgi:intracellular septation protein A